MLTKKTLDMLKAAGVAEYRDGETYVRFFDAKPARAEAAPEPARAEAPVVFQNEEPIDERGDLNLPPQPERPRGWSPD